MRKKLLKVVCGVIMCFLLLYSCRQELDLATSNQQKREEAFFKTDLTKLTSIQKQVLNYLKQKNEKSHFVNSLKDQSGLPVWETTRFLKDLDKKEETESYQKTVTLSNGNLLYSVPLIAEGFVTSVLYSEIKDGEVISYREITNEDLWQIINNDNLDKNYREFVLLNCLLYDKELFKNHTFINIPFGLLGIQEGLPRRIKLLEEEVSEENQLKAFIESCFTWTSNCTCPGEWGGCDGCNNNGQCVPHRVCSWSWYDDGSSGGSGGGNGGGGYGGGGTPNPNLDPDPCTLAANKAFYRLAPNCNGGGIVEPNTPPNPCIKLKELLADTKFKLAFQQMTQPAIFDLNFEKVIYVSYPPLTTTGVEPSYISADLTPCATEGIIDVADNVYGLFHDHQNQTCYDNEKPVKVPSPIDIATFLNVLMPHSMSSTGNYSNAYSVITTSSGSYMLMYEGFSHPGVLDDTNKEFTKLNNFYKDEYEKLYEENSTVTQTDLERLITKFMKEKLNRPGVKLYKVAPNSAIKLEYDPTEPDEIKKTTCP